MQPFPGNSSSSFSIPSPWQLEVLDWTQYSLIVDARCPDEYALDHIPGAVNLPALAQEQFAEVNSLLEADPLAASFKTALYSLPNIAGHLEASFSSYGIADRFLVYSHASGNRSTAWVNTLRLAGFTADVLYGGWTAYRQWVVSSLDVLPRHLNFRVLRGRPFSGSELLLHHLASQGQQTLDLQEICRHHADVVSRTRDHARPQQAFFDSLLLEALRRHDPDLPIWVVAPTGSELAWKLPDALLNALQAAFQIEVAAPINERVMYWRRILSTQNDCREIMSAVLSVLPQAAQYLDRFTSSPQGQVSNEVLEYLLVNHVDSAYTIAKLTLPVTPHRLMALPSLAPDSLDVAAATLTAELER